MMEGRIRFQGSPDEMESNNYHITEMLPQLLDSTKDDRGLADGQPNCNKDKREESKKLFDRKMYLLLSWSWKTRLQAPVCFESTGPIVGKQFAEALFCNY